MKKIVLLILSVSVLTSCSSGGAALHEELSLELGETEVVVEPLLVDDIQDELDGYYESEKFGIRFELNGNMYPYYVSSTGEDLRESVNGIGFEEYGDRIKVFYKDESQTIESAILELIEANGANPNDCIVLHYTDDWLTNDRYSIDLAEPEFDYSEEDLIRIAEADEQASLDGGPFNGDWMERKIYSERLVDLCTEYADPAGLATSTSIGSYFEYNEESTKDRFIFLEESYDREFYLQNTFEFM